MFSSLLGPAAFFECVVVDVAGRLILVPHYLPLHPSSGVFFKPVKPKRAASRVCEARAPLRYLEQYIHSARVVHTRLPVQVQAQDETPAHTQDVVNGSVPAPEDQQTGGASLVVHIAAAIVQRTCVPCFLTPINGADCHAATVPHPSPFPSSRIHSCGRCCSYW
jgi:hypothetical protein